MAIPLLLVLAPVWLAPPLDPAPPPRWVDLRDLGAHASNPLPPDFPRRFSRRLGHLRRDVGHVGRLHFRERPQRMADGRLRVPLMAYASRGRGDAEFIDVDVLTDSTAGRIDALVVARSVPLGVTSFSIRVGQAQLKMIVEDPDHDVRMLFPIGAAALDFGVTTRSRGRTILATPNLDGHIARTSSLRNRADPWYYKDQPFLRIIPAGHPWSVFGFHAPPWSEGLRRGFLSLGCIRMRIEDLREVYRLLRYGGAKTMRVSIRNTLREIDDHPFPKQLHRYRSVVREVQVPPSTHLLIATQLVREAVPLTSLYPYAGYWPSTQEGTLGADH